MRRRKAIVTAAIPAVLGAALLLAPALGPDTLTTGKTLLAAAAAQAAQGAPQGGRGGNVSQGTDGLGALMPPEGAKPHLDKIKLPAGFSIALWAENVRGARTMTLAPDGTVFVGTWQMGNVYA